MTGQKKAKRRNERKRKKYVEKNKLEQHRNIESGEFLGR